jgi:hypothetical protein
MSRSDEYCRFTAECLKMARTAENEQNRAIFLQMATGVVYPGTERRDKCGS